MWPYGLVQPYGVVQLYGVVQYMGHTVGWFVEPQRLVEHEARLPLLKRDLTRLMVDMLQSAGGTMLIPRKLLVASSAKLSGDAW